jgi:DtxR family Mn-dependent transcriptional regulator
MWLVLIAAVILGLVLLWPKAGWLSRLQAARRLTARAQEEDALKHILKTEVNGQVPTLTSVAGALHLKPSRAAALLKRMEERGFISHDQGRLKLCRSGRELALHIIRAHRLWESYLADQSGMAEADWHPQAERQEHVLSPQQADALSARLGYPSYDPHGDRIPEPGGELPAETALPLTALPRDTPARITHIEDEPEAIYAQLLTLGLRPGLTVTVLEKNPQQIRFWADGSVHVLAQLLANNISVEPLPGVKPGDLLETHNLAELQPGQQARVLGLAPACRGAERRRLLDLGFVPGTVVQVEMVSPAGDPVAYRLRDSVVALRRQQAALIRIRPEEPAVA